MNRSIVSVSLLAALCVGGLVAQSPQSTDVPDLLRPHEKNADPQLGKLGGLRFSKRHHVDFDLLDRSQPGQQFRMEFFKSIVYTAKVTKREVAPTLTNGYHLHGTLVGKPGSQFIITVSDVGIGSWFNTMDFRPYELTLQGTRTRSYARLFEDRGDQCGCCAGKANMPGWLHKAYHDHFGGGGPITSNANTGCNDSRNVIYVTAAYTSLAFSQSFGVVRTYIANGIAVSNTVMKNSGLAVRFYLRRNANIGNHPVEQRSMLDILKAVTHPTDKAYDVIHSWRATDKGDLVALIVGSLSGHGNTAGIAWRPGSTASMTRSTGFSVTEHTNLGLTLTHELCHNFGCGHDPKNVGTNLIYPYARGFNKKFCEQGFPTYRKNWFYTVMSYAPSMSGCGFPWSCYRQRVASLSGTNITWNFGSPCGKHVAGSSTQRNNIVVANTSQYVANYYKSTVTRLISVTSNASRPACVTVNVKDNHGRTTLCTTATFEYCSTLNVTLTAPALVGSDKFKRWRVGSRYMPIGTRTVTVSTGVTRNSLVAEYYRWSPGSWRTLGVGCVGSNRLTPRLSPINAPNIGNKITLRVSNARGLSGGLMTLGLSKTRWGSIPLPLNLSVIGATNCLLYTSLDFQFPISTNTSGVSDTTMTVQNVPSTIGMHFYWQGTVFDAGAPRATKLAQTNALDMVVGGHR